MYPEGFLIFSYYPYRRVYVINIDRKHGITNVVNS